MVAQTTRGSKVSTSRTRAGRVALDIITVHYDEPQPHTSGTGQRFTEPRSSTSGTGQRFTEPQSRTSGTGQKFTEPRSNTSGTGQRFTEPRPSTSRTGQRFTEPQPSTSGTGQRCTEPQPSTSGTGQRFTEPRLSSSGTGQRFTDVSRADVTNFILDHENSNTASKTKGHVNLLKCFILQSDDNRDIHDIPPVELNTYLARFFLSVRSKNGSEYEPSTLRGKLGSFIRHLYRKSYIYYIISLLQASKLHIQHSIQWQGSHRCCSVYKVYT